MNNSIPVGGPVPTYAVIIYTTTNNNIVSVKLVHGLKTVRTKIEKF